VDSAEGLETKQDMDRKKTAIMEWAGEQKEDLVLKLRGEPGGEEKD
jgi:hypothetical protein